MVAGVAVLASCYAETTNDCYYYYGYEYGYPYCDYAYSEPYTPPNGYEPAAYHVVEPAVTPNPSPDVAAKLSDSSVLISKFLYLRRTSDTGDTPAADVLNEAYPCGQGEDALTLCAVENVRARDTDYVIIGVQVATPVPLDGELDFLVVGFAFDADGVSTNNYEPPAAQAFDYFGGTDRWYATKYEPATGWQLQAYGLIAGAPSPIDSEARVILQEGTAVLVVPASEFSANTPGARFSFFRHRGDMGTGPDANWSGLVYPPLDKPLAGL
jgi:hypothetical protein